MDAYLDNPIWFGLLTGNQHFAIGSGAARYFPAQVASFAGVSQFNQQAFDDLAAIIPKDATKATFAPTGTTVPAGWNLVSKLEIHQMLFDQATVVPLFEDEQLVELTTEHIPEMQFLTKLTNPGPFTERTIEFGNYAGIFDDSKLVAMAGQRLQPGNFSEISAVCTHPLYLGNGFARRLLWHQVGMITASGKCPVLHVKTDNAAAIGLYKSMGFRIRRQFDVIVFNQLVKAGVIKR